MKDPLEIILRTIHLGSARRVVTLDFGEGSPAGEFLLDLDRTDPHSSRKLMNRIRVAAEFTHYANEQNFKPLKGGFYEFKTRNPARRLYAFYDEIPGIDPQLIIAASGSGKKQQAQAIAAARAIRERYLNAKEKPETHIRIKEREEQ